MRSFVRRALLIFMLVMGSASSLPYPSNSSEEDTISENTGYESDDDGDYHWSAAFYMRPAMAIFVCTLLYRLVRKIKL
jgi:hypothetical protein